LLSLEFLEANNVWLSFAEPSQEVFQPLVDVVDVESDDLHCSGLNRRYSPPLCSQTITIS
jgi:hypothetical protein